MSRSNLLQPPDTDSTDYYDKESNPGIKTFNTLVGLMLAAMLLFTLLFMTCLVVMWTGDGRFGRSSGKHGHFQSYSGMDSVRHALAPDRLSTAKGPRANACILILSRNEDLRPLIDTLRQFEDRFNKRHNYPYVFLNDRKFTPEFEYSIRNILGHEQVTFSQISESDWAMPNAVDKTRALESRRRLSHVIHGASLSYRKMCRWFSGRFMDHPALLTYEWFWRIEPGVSFMCDIPNDPFVQMSRNKKVIGFSILMSEIEETIPGLFDAVMEFKKVQRLYPHPKLWNYFTYQGRNSTTFYNGCHIWNNFEIARFDFFRSAQYRKYFEHIDRKGGFFYERWGDAPVISLAAALFLRPDQLHHFTDIGYRHDQSSFCPGDSQTRTNLLCSCDPYDGGDTTLSGCMTLWQRMMMHDDYYVRGGQGDA
jgi:alpha 1,2-mannosyltransferase